MPQNSFQEKFQTHIECIKFLEKHKWSNTPTCSSCGCQKTSKKKHGFRYTCLGCNSSFSVLVGTVFESTKLPLQKWFKAIFIILEAKKGISSCQLARHINVHRNTAWLMQLKLRSALSQTRNFRKFIFSQIKQSTLIENDRRVYKTPAKSLILLDSKLRYLFNRSIVGQYHGLSQKHLQGYANELSYKFKHKNSLNFGFNNFLALILQV